MDNLERFYPENLNKETIEEINSMSTEELTQLENIPGFFLVRDKSSGKPYTGQSTYKNLAVLHRLGFSKRYEVVGVHENSIKNNGFDEEITAKDEFIAPEQVIIDTENPDSAKDPTETHPAGDQEPEPEAKAHDDHIQNIDNSAPEKEIPFQEYTTGQVKESIIYPVDGIEPEKEMIADSKDPEPIQNAAPEEGLKPEADENKAAERKTEKAQPAENKPRKAK